MAIQQLTQPIINPISAFDAIKSNTISFVVIGGAQVVGNRLVISNNETGVEIYNQSQLTMKLEHTIPANTLINGGYYNAVVYTMDNSGTESSPSIAIPFYCFSQPILTIDNIPGGGTIENGTYTFTGSYLQQENEMLNSYQYTLYNSNKEVLSQTSLIYYSSDSSLSYTFVGMSNDTSYYIELTGETINGTKISSGVMFFTVRYSQPASFAICDLVNDCENGYIQISSNIVAIDGHSNPSPPIYINDKEVDLRDEDSWVEWNSGFRIQNDFTMRIWGRNFNEYENIVTLTNNINTSSVLNKIELKWMLGDIIKTLPNYNNAKGYNVNIIDSQEDLIKNLIIGGNSIKINENEIYSLGNIKNLINLDNFNITYNQQYYQSNNTNFILKPNYIYTLSFNYNINSETTDIYYSIGYGETEYEIDINNNIQYLSQNNGRNSISFKVPVDIPENNYLWVKFAKTIILADIDVDISNIQLEEGKNSTDYQTPDLYNIYAMSTSKNIYNYKKLIYIQENNCSYNEIQNGYEIFPTSISDLSNLAIGFNNILTEGNTYSISYSQLGDFKSFNLYTTDKNSQDKLIEVNITDGSFIAPSNLYDLQLIFEVDNSVLSNSLQIWNIQIEASNIPTYYEPYNYNSSNIVLDDELRGIDTYRDLICLESPNLLNPNTKSCIVQGSTAYYLNQEGTINYHIWYYNEAGNLIVFINEDGDEASGVTGMKGSFTTHENCTKITITKSSDPDSNDVTMEELISNNVSIVEGNSETIYYPYVSEPSLIKYINKTILTGEETISKVEEYTNTIVFNILTTNARMDGECLCNKFQYSSGDDDIEHIKLDTSNPANIKIFINKSRLSEQNVNGFKIWLSNLYNSNLPLEVYYQVNIPIVIPLSESNVNALKILKSYNPITNVYTNNSILGTMDFKYVTGYSEQQTVNSYVILRCWNGNTMPYICHSNYIDIPENTSKIFIWIRRKNNLFDIQIVDLGDYGEDDQSTDTTEPTVTLEIDENYVTSTEIPVTALAIDNNGLSIIRFSKDNGTTWDEVIVVDGLATTQNYTFEDLDANTIYTIRVEAIDISGNIGGISQQVKTKA